MNRMTKAGAMLAEAPGPVRVEGAADRDDAGALALLRLAWRGKGLVLLFVLLGLGAGAAYVFGLATPLYTAQAVVALEDQEAEIVDVESVVGGLSSDQATINTQMGLIQSRELVGKLVEQLDLVEDPEFNPTLVPVPPWSPSALVERLLGPARDSVPSEETAFVATVDEVLEIINVSNVRESYIIQIWMRTTSPAKSARMANALADIYVLDQLELKFQATEQATGWLSERVVGLKQELEDAETRLGDFTASTQLISAEGLTGLSVQVKDLRQRLANKRAALAELSGAIAAVEERLDTASPGELAAMADDVLLVRLADQVDEGQLGRAAFDARVRQYLDRRRAERQRSEQQIEVLAGSIAELEEAMGTQSAELVVLQQLEREVEASALIYESFLSRLKELSVQQGIHQPEVRIYSRAVVPDEPSAPLVVPILALTGVLGLFAGSGFVLLREMLQNVFRTPEELERLTGLPVLGQIPKAPTGRRGRLLQHVIEKPTSAFSEAVRNLRTSILLSDIDAPPQVLMLTSSVPGEGKTTQSLSLAHNLSLMGKNVLLIEADIRRRTFSEYFDVPDDQPGLVAAVAERRPLGESAFRSEELGIDILLGEKSRTNAADFFSSDAFGSFLEQVRKAYDFVLLDTPPVLAVPDARVIGRLADAIVYVVRWDSTARSQVSAGLRAFHSLKLPIAGLVLSQVDAKGLKRYGYGGGYGADGSGYYES